MSGVLYEAWIGHGLGQYKAGYGFRKYELIEVPFMSPKSFGNTFFIYLRPPSSHLFMITAVFDKIGSIKSI
jgi:hypothetical protein